MIGKIMFHPQNILLREYAEIFFYSGCQGTFFQFQKYSESTLLGVCFENIYFENLQLSSSNVSWVTREDLTIIRQRKLISNNTLIRLACLNRFFRELIIYINTLCNIVLFYVSLCTTRVCTKRGKARKTLRKKCVLSSKVYKGCVVDVACYIVFNNERSVTDITERSRMRERTYQQHTMRSKPICRHQN